MTRKDALTLIEYIRKQSYTPNDWENNFLDNIEHFSPDPLTYKQHLALENIYAKATGGGKYIRR